MNELTRNPPGIGLLLFLLIVSCCFPVLFLLPLLSSASCFLRLPLSLGDLLNNEFGSLFLLLLAAPVIGAGSRSLKTLAQQHPRFNEEHSGNETRTEPFQGTAEVQNPGVDFLNILRDGMETGKTFMAASPIPFLHHTTPEVPQNKNRLPNCEQYIIIT